MSYQQHYSLDQHTPIVHFQYMEEGATLRATEVKPKLDRYLARMLQKEPTEGSEAWFQRLSGSDGTPAAGPHFRYKLRFSCPESERIELGYQRGAPVDYSIFWANQGKTSEQAVRGLMAKGQVKLTVTCMIPGLQAFIDRHIAGFFFTHNFGRMQSKGFGSFSVSGRSTQPNDVTAALCDQYRAPCCYSFAAAGQPFQRIKTLWSVIRSGYNFQRYRRSLLFMYMHERRGIGNEKAWMKQQGFAGRHPLCKPEHEHNCQEEQRSTHRHYYVRALLGAGDHVDFLIDPKNPRNKHSVKIGLKGDADSRFRYHSPVFFKVVGNQVYFVGEPVNPAMLGAAFVFSGGDRSNPPELPTPTADMLGPDFITDLLDYCYQHYEKPPEGQFALSALQPGLIVKRHEAPNQ